MGKGCILLIAIQPVMDKLKLWIYDKCSWKLQRNLCCLYDSDAENLICSSFGFLSIFYAMQYRRFLQVQNFEKLSKLGFKIGLAEEPNWKEVRWTFGLTDWIRLKLSNSISGQLGIKIGQLVLLPIFILISDHWTELFNSDFIVLRWQNYLLKLSIALAWNSLVLKTI